MWRRLTVGNWNVLEEGSATLVGPLPLGQGTAVSQVSSVTSVTAWRQTAAEPSPASYSKSQKQRPQQCLHSQPPDTNWGQSPTEGQEGLQLSRQTGSSVTSKPKTCTCCNYSDQGRSPCWQGLCPERGLVGWEVLCVVPSLWFIGHWWCHSLSCI